MGQRCHINNLRHFNTRAMHGADSRLAPVTRSFHVCLHFPQAKIVCDFRTILCSHLRCIRSVLLGTAESHLTCGRPRNDLAFAVCQRHNNVVERAMHMQLPHSVNLHISFLSCDCFLCHILTII